MFNRKYIEPSKCACNHLDEDRLKCIEDKLNQIVTAITSGQITTVTPESGLAIWNKLGNRYIESDNTVTVDYDDLDNRISANTSNLNTLTTDIETVDGNVDILRDVIDNLTSLIADHEYRITDLENGGAALNDDLLETLKTNIANTVVDPKLTTIKLNVNTLRAGLTSVSSDVSQLSSTGTSEVLRINGVLNSQSTSIGKVNSTVTALNSQVLNLMQAQENFSGVILDINSIKTLVSTLNSGLDTANTKIEQTSTDVLSLSTAFNTTVLLSKNQFMLDWIFYGVNGLSVIKFPTCLLGSSKSNSALYEFDWVSTFNTKQYDLILNGDTENAIDCFEVGGFTFGGDAEETEPSLSNKLLNNPTFIEAVNRNGAFAACDSSTAHIYFYEIIPTLVAHLHLSVEPVVPEVRTYTSNISNSTLYLSTRDFEYPIHHHNQSWPGLNVPTWSGKNVDSKIMICPLEKTSLSRDTEIKVRFTTIPINDATVDGITASIVRYTNTSCTDISNSISVSGHLDSDNIFNESFILNTPIDSGSNLGFALRVPNTAQIKLTDLVAGYGINAKTLLEQNAEAIKATAISKIVDEYGLTIDTKIEAGIDTLMGTITNRIDAVLANLNGAINTVTSQFTQTAAKASLELLENGVEKAGLHLDGNNSSIRAVADHFAIGKINSDSDFVPTFSVDADGNLSASGSAYIKGIIHATGGEFTGDVKANSGNIAGFEINNDYIHKGDLYLGTEALLEEYGSVISGHTSGMFVYDELLPDIKRIAMQTLTSTDALTKTVHHHQITLSGDKITPFNASGYRDIHRNIIVKVKASPDSSVALWEAIYIARSTAFTYNISIPKSVTNGLSTPILEVEERILATPIDGLMQYLDLPVTIKCYLYTKNIYNSADGSYASLTDEAFELLNGNSHVLMNNDTIELSYNNNAIKLNSTEINLIFNGITYKATTTDNLGKLEFIRQL